jgi:hypothetical protein
MDNEQAYDRIEEFAPVPTTVVPEWLEDVEHLRAWSMDVFMFAEETMGIMPAECLDELRGAEIPYTTPFGERKSAKLFDERGRLLWHDLTFYTRDMFKNQTPKAFKEYHGTRFTWQQTVILTAYNRGLDTFGRDSFDEKARWISTRSGHGIGKTGCESVIGLHFLWCFPGAQIGMTSNSEQQVEDIFMKEIAKWKLRLPQFMQDSIIITSDHIRIEDEKDWFLRAQVARPEKPEALAGLHGPYVLLIVDEASAVGDKTFETMGGALTGECYIVVYFSNPTRNEGEFFKSHRKGAPFVQLHFTSRESPIVRPGYVDTMEAKYPPNGERKSDEVLIRVDGEFAGVADMDDKGWVPLFANINVNFEPQGFQIIKRGIIAVDPAGAGRDQSIVGIRDMVYLKELLNERTSSPPDLARKIEMFRDIYECSSNDIGVDGFGVGAQVVANINTKMGESVNAILADKPREGTEQMFASFKAEMAWKFRKWCAAGGIIVTNNKAAWLKELEAVRFKRDRQGRITLMDKPSFKKQFGFSPDRFDMACYTFFKDDPTQPPAPKPYAEREAAETAVFVQRSIAQAAARQDTSGDGMSSM